MWSTFEKEDILENLIQEKWICKRGWIAIQSFRNESELESIFVAETFETRVFTHADEHREVSTQTTERMYGNQKTVKTKGIQNGWQNLALLSPEMIPRRNSWVEKIAITGSDPKTEMLSKGNKCSLSKRKGLIQFCRESISEAFSIQFTMFPELWWLQEHDSNAVLSHKRVFQVNTKRMRTSCVYHVCLRWVTNLDLGIESKISSNQWDFLLRKV
jgi:hypothetical protein